MWVLIAHGGPADGRRIEITDELLIGREGTDIVLDDPRVSRRHARVRPTPAGLQIEDLGSTNGTFVDGMRIGSPAALTDASTISIGATTFRLDPEAAAVIPAPQTIVGVLPQATEIGTGPGAAAAPSPPSLRPAGPAVTAAPPQFDPAPHHPPGIGGVATRRWLPTSVTIGAIVLTSILLLVYFAVR